MNLFNFYVPGAAWELINEVLKYCNRYDRTLTLAPFDLYDLNLLVAKLVECFKSVTAVPAHITNGAEDLAKIYFALVKKCDIINNVLNKTK